MRGQVSELRFSSEEWFMPNQILQVFVLPMSSITGAAALLAFARDFATASARLMSATVK